MSDEGQFVVPILERLRATVAERRTSGQYPPNLEADLDAHFRRIASARGQMPQLANLRRQIEAVRQASRFSPARIPTSTRVPGGAAIHKGMSRLFLRQAHGILLQVQEFADRTLEAFEAIAGLADRPDSHHHSDLIEQIDALREELAALTVSGTTGGGDRPGDLADVARRLERLEEAEAARRWRPWFGRDRFNSVFDDGRRQKLAELAAAALGDRAPIVDLSSTACENPVAAVAAHGDATLGGVVATGADELLTSQQVVDLVAVAFERLAPDGRLLVSRGAPAAPGENASPHPHFNPTLGPPLPAPYVAFTCREAGFAAVEVDDWSEHGYLVVATR